MDEYDINDRASRGDFNVYKEQWQIYIADYEDGNFV